MLEIPGGDLIGALTAAATFKLSIGIALDRRNPGAALFLRRCDVLLLDADAGDQRRDAMINCIIDLGRLAFDNLLEPGKVAAGQWPCQNIPTDRRFDA